MGHGADQTQMTVTYEVGGSSGGHLDIDFYVSEQSRRIDPGPMVQ
jgi:hypothetical protein